MARTTYSLPRKVEALLKAEHGITASVSGDDAGLKIVVGAFEEVISGVVTREKIAELAGRIKGTGHG